MSSNTYSTDPALFIVTSLTAGSSHIVTATSRLETILRANRVPFKAVDLAVDQKARMLWGRRAGKDESGRVRKLPGLIQEGLVLGDLVEIEDWNEYGELKQHVKIYYDEHTIPNIHNKPKEPPKPIRKKPVAAAASTSASSSSSAKPAPPPPAPPLPSDGKKDDSSNKKDEGPSTKAKVVEKAEKAALPIRSVADEAAQKAKDMRLKALREKVHGSKAAKGEDKKEEAAEEEEKNEEEQEAEESKEAVDSKSSSAVSVYSTAASNSKGASQATTVQSPTTGTWAPATTSTDSLPPRETVQSPTTARWKSIESLDLPVTSHRGSTVAAASQEEIHTVEEAEAIPEAEDEEDSEEDSSDDDENGDDKKKTEEKPKEEGDSEKR